MSQIDVVRIVEHSNPALYSLHLNLTTQCNLNCPDCYYREPVEAAWTWIRAEQLLKEAAMFGVRWVAVGGGEPLLWPHLDQLITYAHDLDMRVAITTNGIQRRQMWPDRVHISYDRMHKTTRKQVLEVIAHYAYLGCNVGLNVIASDEEFVEQLPWQAVDEITLLLEKPNRSEDLSWILGCLGRHEKDTMITLDGCLCKRLINLPCSQGRISMSINTRGQCGPCSNLPRTIPLTTLRETWGKIRLCGEADACDL